MAKRLIIGDDGTGNFRMRQSAAGHSVDETSLDFRLFDADFYPGRILGRGAFNMSGGASGAGSASSPHGLGKAPDMLIAMGTPLDGSYNPSVWRYMYTISGQSGIQTGDIGNGNMNARPCTPFYFAETVQSLAPGNGQGGWVYSYDAANINVTFYNLSFSGPVASRVYMNLRVDWIALEG